MLNHILLAAAPLSQAWSPTVAIVMVVANVLGVLAAVSGVQKKAGPQLPGGLSVAQIIGGTCFGHILGAGAILGLTSQGVI
jgi:photosystem I subunit 10